MSTENELEKTTLGGGCFWCLEAVYQELRGVTRIVSGYAGGDTVNPTYKEVCSGNTGHAEVVQLTYDPQQVTFKELLQVFFTIHDPTQLNRQGADVGTQYRSVIFYHDADQEQVARETIRELTAEGLYDAPIVTQVEPLELFYEGEDYHQEYYSNNKWQPYCMMVITPKVAKFRKKFVGQLKAKA